jgi:Calcineurin-like phosphoesterase
MPENRPPLVPLSEKVRPEISAQLKAAGQNPLLQQQAASLVATLEASEWLLIDLMYNSKFYGTNTRVWSGPLPANPQPGVTPYYEYSLAPYFLNNPGKNKILQDLVWLWKLAGYPLPRCLLTVNDSPTVSNYKNLIKGVTPPNAIVGGDGTLFGEEMYEQLDPGWLFAMGEYVFHYYREKPDLAPFPTGTNIVPVKGSSTTQISFAMMGDWGTGPYGPDQPSRAVRNAMEKIKPDYIIHLGDVYYAGAPFEEQLNLLNEWPAAWKGKSFTLNSNHEMYDGGWGYFQVALDKTGIFSAQKGISYFALTFGTAAAGGPWTMLCLDSAYWSTSNLIMEGSLTNPKSTLPGNMAQRDFITGQNFNPKKTIVVTHHNPLEYDGSGLIDDGKGNALWAQLTQYLKGFPAAWYWGHVHNGIVYTTTNATKSPTYCRCAGHGAIPFGSAWGCQAAFPNPVAWYANTPNPNKAAYPRMLNGFVVLTITTSGAGAGTVSETFYNQDGTVAKGAFTYRLG